MAAFTAYFDASGSPDDPNCHALTVAGFIASAEQWLSFDKAWKKVLRRYGVGALHMKHFAHSQGEFRSWKGDTVTRNAFMSELITVLQRKVRHSFTSTVDLKDYRQNDEKHHIRDICSPFAIGGMQVTRGLMKLTESMRLPKEHLLLLFEDGDIDKGNMETWVSGTYGIKPRFEGKAQVKAFEACDLLAYEAFQVTRKVFPEPGVYGLEDLRKSFQRLADIPHVVADTDTWGIVHNPDMETSIHKMFAAMPRLKEIASSSRPS